MVASPRLVSARVCLVDSRARPSPYPLAKPACSISQAALVLTRPSGCGQAGAPSGTASGSMTGLVKNEPALQVSWSAGVEHHALAAAQAEHRLAHLGQRRALADLDAEGAGELGVARPGRRACPGQLEGHVEHDVAAGVGLEAGVAVAEPAVGVGEGADAAQLAVPDPHGRDGLGDLLAVGADVLDRGGADRAGDAGQGLDADPAPGDGGGDDVVPVLARGDGHQHAAARGVVLAVAGVAHAARRDLDDDPGEALVGDHHVGAAAQHQHRFAGGVGGGHRVDQLGLGGGGDPARGRSAQPQRGVVAAAQARTTAFGIPSTF